MTDIFEFLPWIVYGGGGAIAISWILEQVQWYQNQSAKAKKNIFFGFSAVLTIAIYVFMTYVPQNAIEAIAPFFSIIAAAFISTYIGTGYHRAATPSKTTIIDVCPDEPTMVMIAEEPSKDAEKEAQG